MAETVTVRLKPDIINQLNLLSEKTHRPRSYYVQQAISNYLEQYMEDVEDIADAIRIHSTIEAGQMKEYTLDEVRNMLEL